VIPFSLASVLGHGGAGGAIIESLVVVTIVVIFVLVWLHSRGDEGDEE
jgi:hypothetical protein